MTDTPLWMQKRGIEPGPRRLGTKAELLTVDGPGSQLIRLFDRNAAGDDVPMCPRCIELASQMNGLGVDGCRQRIAEITEDILPRASKWLTKVAEGRVPGLEPGLIDHAQAKAPEFVKRMYIRWLVNRAIDRASANEKKKGRQQRRAVGRGAKVLPVNLALTEAPDPIVTDLGPRHLIYHLYPVRGNGHWQWNVEQLLRRIDLFNGVRSIAVVTPGYTHSRRRGTPGRGEHAPLDSVERVQRAFEGVRIDHWLTHPNDPTLREVATRDALQQTVPREGVVFSAHAKGTTFPDQPTAIRQWTELMYAANCDLWDGLVERLLQWYYMAGAFQVQQRWGASAWHYSGAFYWFRAVPALLDAPITRQWFGTETWPGEKVAFEHAACVFGRGVGANGTLYEEQTMAEQFEKFTSQNR